MATNDSMNWASIVQALSWAGAVLTAIVGAIGFFVTQRKARVQRAEEIEQRKEANLASARELQWRRSGAAQMSIERLEADGMAAEAMLMLDWDGRLFPTGAKTQWRMWEADMLAALRTSGDPFKRSEVFVRDAFDRLFWHFERIQNQIEVELIELAHVHFPLAYLIMRMDKNHANFEAYLKAYGYRGTLRLMEALRATEPVAIAIDYSDTFALRRAQEEAEEVAASPAP